MQIWAESGKSALPICNYSQILYQFLTFTQNLKRSLDKRKNTSYLSNNCKYDVFYNYVKILNLMTLAGRLSFFALLLNFRKEI